MKKSSYQFGKEWKEYTDFPIRKIKNGKRSSLYKKKYQDRVFNHNMIEGLCYGKFYGRQKIIFQRKEHGKL